MRWIPYADAYRITTINLDQVLWIECHQGSYEPLALIETAQDIGQRQKNVTAVTTLAKRGGGQSIPRPLFALGRNRSRHQRASDRSLSRSATVGRQWPAEER
jgi:hypothetical protein